MFIRGKTERIAEAKTQNQSALILLFFYQMKH